MNKQTEDTNFCASILCIKIKAAIDWAIAMCIPPDKIKAIVSEVVNGRIHS